MKAAFLAAMFGLTLLSLPSFAQAQAVGERVITTDEVEMKDATKSFGMVPVGTIVTVERTDGTWLGVLYQSHRGWIASEKVTTLKKGIEYFTKLLIDEPAPGWYVVRANIYIELKDWNRAINDCSQALNLDPAFATALDNRGFIYNAQGKYDKAIADFSQAIKIKPQDPLGYHLRGIAYMNKGNYEQGFKDLNQALTVNPTFLPSLMNRSMAYNNRGQYDKAIADFDTIQKLDPHNSFAYLNRGIAYYQMDQYQKSIEQCTEAIRLDPKESTAYGTRGASWLELKDYTKAVADLDVAIRLDPLHIVAFNNRGQAKQHLGEYPAAIADFEKAMSLQPNFYFPTRNLCTLYASCPDATARNGEKAIVLGLKCCELTNNKDWKCLRSLAAAYAEFGDFDKAMETQKLATELCPETEKQPMEDRMKLYASKKPYHESK